MTLANSAQEMLTLFSTAAGWEQRMRLLMQVGASLEPLTITGKNQQNQITGCESDVWLVANCENNLWQFKATSDARLIRGLLAVLLVRVNGLTNDQLQQVDLEEWFTQLGLARQLSSSRRDGLRAIFKRIKTFSQA